MAPPVSSAQHCVVSPHPRSNDNSTPVATESTQEECTSPAMGASLLPQIISETALIVTDQPPPSHTNLPDASASSRSDNAPVTKNSDIEESSGTFLKSADCEKLYSELRTLCTALLAIPDKLASVCCACPAPLRPRNLLPQLFISLIRVSPIQSTIANPRCEMGQGLCMQLMHVHVALAALVTSATLRGHADTIARWLHQCDAHACVQPQSVPSTTTCHGADEQKGGGSTESSSGRSPHVSGTCMTMSRALAHVSAPNVHERLWHALLEASVQKLETQKPSSWTLVDPVVSRGMFTELWLQGTAHALPRVQHVTFWVKLLTTRGARLPPAALLHAVLVSF